MVMVYGVPLAQRLPAKSALATLRGDHGLLLLKRDTEGGQEMLTASLLGGDLRLLLGTVGG